MVYQFKINKKNRIIFFTTPWQMPLFDTYLISKYPTMLVTSQLKVLSARRDILILPNIMKGRCHFQRIYVFNLNDDIF